MEGYFLVTARIIVAAIYLDYHDDLLVMVIF